MAPYEPHLHKEAFEFLLSARRTDREAILRFLHQLAAHPFQNFDFEDRDGVGRPIFPRSLFTTLRLFFWKFVALKSSSVP